MKFKNQKISPLKVMAVAATLMFSSSAAFAANTLTSGVKITRIDATAASGNIRVQTEPRPDVSGLGCGTDFWLVLRADSPNYKQLVAAVLTAKAADFTGTVGADDTTITDGFCEFSRFVID